ncbi:MAG TPA: amino acid adenylation domain-containing protein [Pyrinomonadaceae bacterium]|jgi:amino acid adenylation domain-containing protein
MTTPYTNHSPAVDANIQDASSDDVFAFPTSFAQQRLWFLDQLQPGSAFYNIPAAVRLLGEVNIEVFKEALNETRRRHESLRTTFAMVDGEPKQIIHEAAPVSLTIIDLQELPESEREAEALRQATTEAQRPFNLARGPLFRVSLLRLGPQDHLLLVTMHHIISDGWSMGVMIREVGMLYQAYSAGYRSPLAPLKIQYADYAAWQRKWLAGDLLQAQLKYWKEQLAGIPPLLELPTDKPRPPIQSHRGALLRHALTPELSAAVRALGQQEQTTLFMTLLAAFQTLLSRYSGQQDICVGSPIAGRNRTEIEGLIGCFINTLVLRTDMSGDPSFRELLKRVRGVTLGAFANQEVPFEKLVEELRPEREMSRSPIFQVMFVLQNAGNDAVRLPAGLQLVPVAIEMQSAKFDMTMAVFEGEDALGIVLDYNTDLFEGASMTRLLSHFNMLLESIVADPDQPISTIPLLTPDERRQLLFEWNDTARDYPTDTQCIHQLFEAQVERTPDAVALVCGDHEVSYLELNARANKLAHHLRKLGVGPEVLVGVLMERSVEMVVSLLAILKAGGAYLPLDPLYPQERLAFMLADAEVAVLLTQESLAERVPVGEAAVVFSVDRQWSEIASQSEDNASSAVGAGNLAYLIYTSGSTGRPKGVAIAHQSTHAFLHWSRESFTDEELSGVLASTSICFDLSVFELFAPLSWGGTVILVKDALHLLMGETRRPVRLINTVPSAMAELVRADGVPGSVRTVNLAGEALSAQLVEMIYEQEHVRQVRNLYGPSEDTTYSTNAFVKKGESPAIGRPLALSEAYVLDERMEPVPVGVLGELYLGGAGLARGYLKRPGQTAERFVPDPFSGRAGARLYRTGDVVKYRADGELEYLRRKDHQVKVRGFRIELGEVEAVLEQAAGVRTGVVLVREDRPGEKRLVGYVQAEEGQTPGVEELLGHMREKLPTYMVPSVLMILDELPLTANGKVDRKALPAPSGSRPDLRREYVEPRTEVERSIAEMCAELLGIERVGVHDNFFELGGHSLMAMQLISRVRATFTAELALQGLFKDPTVESLAAAVEEAILSKSNPDEMDEMLSMLEELGDEEALNLLSLEDPAESQQDAGSPTA